ncbi:hypothetical protein CBG55_04425 [Prevotella intermedia]|uniref:Uncharacterized protein n=1 Tax=Prevotella intermedia TaxID=28131 RepID=A0A2M8TN31_PREIN|nr:hypothetical protein CBG55_04425 [Prevotella intermedia]PJI25348.1 hypothetical protein CTM59_04415 [Prevotella intermedia]
MQKSHFYTVKVALLKGQSVAFATRFCSFRDILCLILHNEKTYSIHIYTHNSILTADRQKDKYCTQKVPLFAIDLLAVQKNANIGVFHGRKLTIQDLYFIYINKTSRYSLQYNKEQPRRQTLPYSTAF